MVVDLLLVDPLSLKSKKNNQLVQEHIKWFLNSETLLIIVVDIDDTG